MTSPSFGPIVAVPGAEQPENRAERPRFLLLHRAMTNSSSSWENGAQYFGAIVLGGLAFRLLYREFSADIATSLGFRRQRADLLRVYQALLEIEELLGAGVLPEKEKWESLKALPEPWGTLAYDSLQELRSSGGAVLPTLRRLKDLVSAQVRALADAKARSAQAMMQALSCAVLIPLFGVTLYELLPGVSEYPCFWGGLCLVALFFAGIGALWLLSMSQNARWAGLSKDARPWILAAQCAGERFLALVRAGLPADLAWTRAVELLSREAPSLALLWGSSIWKAPAVPATTLLRDDQGATGRLFAETGDALRKTVQVSLMEGRPCSDRIESALSSLSHEIKARVEAELTLLSTRALRPLFICVAPGIFLLLGAGFILCLLQSSAGGGLL